MTTLERPIPFVAPMVLAVLDGSKTMTRRPVRGQPADVRVVPEKTSGGRWQWMSREIGGWARIGEPFSCPYGAPGDRLWVRESYALPHAFDGHPPSAVPKDARVHHLASEPLGGLIRRPGMFMCRWMSRITLEVIEVSVDRLYTISEADCKAEGVRPLPSLGKWTAEGCGMRPTAKLAFQALWEHVNGDDSWRPDSWVWIVRFRKLET